MIGTRRLMQKKADRKKAAGRKILA